MVVACCVSVGDDSFGTTPKGRPVLGQVYNNHITSSNMKHAYSGRKRMAPRWVKFPMHQLVGI